MDDRLANAANMATVVSVAVSLGILFYRWYRWDMRREKFASEAPQRQAARESVLGHFTRKLKDLDGQLPPEQLHLWLQQTFDNPKSRESVDCACHRLTSTIDRLVCWAKLRQAYAKYKPLIGTEYTEVQVEEYIRLRMDHGRPVPEVEASARCLEEWFSVLVERTRRNSLHNGSGKGVE